MACQLSKPFVCALELTSPTFTQPKPPAPPPCPPRNRLRYFFCGFLSLPHFWLFGWDTYIYILIPFSFLFPERTFWLFWNRLGMVDRRQTETHTIIEICSALLFYFILFPLTFFFFFVFFCFLTSFFRFRFGLSLVRFSSLVLSISLPLAPLASRWLVDKSCCGIDRKTVAPLSAMRPPLFRLPFLPFVARRGRVVSRSQQGRRRRHTKT